MRRLCGCRVIGVILNPFADTDVNFCPLHQAAPDREEMLRAIVLFGWRCEKRVLYDEEGVEGWTWIEPDGTEHTEIGVWSELPPWPASARAAIAKAQGEQ